jgi:hypothetical protein
MMNEYIEARLRRKNRPLPIRRQVPDGIELDEPDPIQRTVYVGFDAANEVTRYRLRRVRQLQGWEPSQFKLKMAVEDGALKLRGVDPFALPPGRYSVQIRLEEARTRTRRRTVQVPDDGHGTLVVDVETDDRVAAIDVTDCDPAVRRILEASILDEQPATAWLAERKRATRKACLLNILASLRIRPARSAPLIDHVRSVFWVSNDRIYTRVDRTLRPTLEALASDPARPFYREGQPHARIHLRLLDHLPEPTEVRAHFTPTGLVSFRGEGRPSLQAVVAEPPPGLPYTYAEFDLDLGNALQDVVGFVTHLGELVDGKPTNHLDLRRDLVRTPARDYIYYDVRPA